MTTKTTRARYGSGGLYQRPDGRWVASTYLTDTDGQRIRKRVYGKTKDEALLKLKEVQELAGAGLPVRQVQGTVGQALTDWSEHVLPLSGRRESTVEDYQLTIKSLVVDLGDVELEKLTPLIINGCVRKWQTRLGSSSIIRRINILAMALDPLVDGKKLRTNPARAKTVAKPRLLKPEVDYFTSDEVQDLLVAAGEHRLTNVLIVAAFTGLRRGEVLALRWKDVDLARGQVSVSGSLDRVGGRLLRQEPKTRASVRNVPIGPEVVRALEAQRALQTADSAASEHWVNAGGLVFTVSTGEPVDPRNLLRWFSGVKRRAKVKHGNWHSLRHSFASYLLLGGTPIHVVSRALGHNRIEITVNTYGHLSSSDLRNAVLGGLTGYGQSESSNVLNLRASGE